MYVYCVCLILLYKIYHGLTNLNTISAKYLICCDILIFEKKTHLLPVLSLKYFNTLHIICMMKIKSQCIGLYCLLFLNYYE